MTRTAKTQFRNRTDGRPRTRAGRGIAFALVVLALLALLPPAPARSAEEEEAGAGTEPGTVVEIVACPVIALEDLGPKAAGSDRRIVVVARGRRDGVVPDGKGRAFAVRYENGAPLPENGTPVGAADVLSVGEETSRVAIRLAEPDRLDVVPNDMVELPLRVPDLERSLLFELAKQGIFLSHLRTTDPLFTFRDLARDETPESVAERLEDMVREIRETGRTFAESEELRATVDSGRYVGRTLTEVLRGAEVRDLDGLLHHMLTWPGNYYGATWNVDATFAAWALDGAPFTVREVVARLAAASPAETAEATLAAAAADLSPADRDAVVTNLLIRARARIDSFDSVGTHRLVDVAIRAAEVLDRPASRRLALFDRAWVLGEESRHEESLEAYRVAIRAYRSADPVGPAELEGIARAFHNMGLARESLGDYGRALAAYRSAIRLKESGAGPPTSLAFTLRVLGDLLVTRGEYGEALAVFERASGIYREEGDRDGLTRALTGRGKALEALGRNVEAAAVYRELLAEHRATDDREAEADALVDIGSQSWSLGDYRAAKESWEASLAIRREIGDRDGEALALQNLGRLAANLGEFERAKECQEAAIRIRRERREPTEVADILTDLGDLHGEHGDYEEALRLFEEALAIQRRLGNRAGEARVSLEIGDLRWDRKEYEEALAAYDRAVALWRECDARNDLAGALRSRGTAYHLLRDYRKAIRDYEEALAIDRETAAPASEVETLYQIGWFFWNRREMDRALETMTEALELARRIGNLRLEVLCLRRIGEIHATSFRIDEALARYREVLAILRGSDVIDRLEISRTLSLVGQALAIRGRFEEALASYREALTIARERDALPEIHAALLNMGAVELQRGELERARETYEESLAAAAGNEWLRALSLENLSWAFGELGEVEKALELQSEVLAILTALRNDFGRANILNSIAHALLRRGDVEAARARIRRALELGATAVDRQSLAVMHSTAGAIESEAGDHAAALAHFDRALAIFREIDDVLKLPEALLLSSRARLEVGTPQALDRAERDLAEARRRFESLGMALFAGEVREVQARVALDRDRPDDALAAADDAGRIAERTGSPHLLWRARFTASRALEAAGRQEEALEVRRAAIEALESLRAGIGADDRSQREFLRSRIDVYESMADLLGHRIDAETDEARRKALMEEALRFVTRARFEILARGTREMGRTGNDAVDDLLARIEKARRGIARLESEIESARAEGNEGLRTELTKVLATNLEELARLHVDLKSADPDLGARLTFDPRYLRDTDALPEGARLVVYFTGERSLFIWVFSRDGFTTWTRHEVPRREIRRLVDAFRERMDEVVRKSRESRGRGFGPEAEAAESNPDWYRRNCEETRRILRELHERLIEPIEAEIEAADPLVLLPHGRLNYLPFEALLDGQGRFLGERKRIAYVLHREHLGLTLRRLRRAPPRGEDVLLAYADPVGNLSESLEEVEELRALFPENEIHTRLTGDATEASLRGLRTDGTILHLATHGYLNGAEPSQTWLEFAAPPGDGKLRQEEVWALGREVPPLREGRIRLVVLSACETARGQTAPEAEVLGMPDAFTLAGAPAVLASLWSVYSWSTTDFMVEFYRRVAEGEADLAAAALGARRALLEDRATARYAHPYYWAPFVLYGDWR